MLNLITLVGEMCAIRIYRFLFECLGKIWVLVAAYWYGLDVWDASAVTYSHLGLFTSRDYNYINYIHGQGPLRFHGARNGQGSV